MRHPVSTLIAALSIVGALVPDAARAQEANQIDAPKVVQSLAPSLVRVEYTLRYDKGQPPAGARLMERCPSCGQYHGDSGEDAVAQERPLETAGYLIRADRVITGEMFLHPRFIEKIEVVIRGERINARTLAHAYDQHATLLQLDRPMSHRDALQFNSANPGPYWVVKHEQIDAQWRTTVSPLALGSIVVSEGQAPFTPVSERGVIVAGDGTPVAMNLTGELAPEMKWKSSPNNWVWFEMPQFEALLERVRSAADRGILRTRLDLRSPRVSESAYSPWDYSASEEDEATEIEALSLLVNAKTVLVLSSLKAPVTARLERITVYPTGSADGVPATFTATLRDYGAFVATLDEPLEGAVTLSTKDIRAYRNQLLAAADLTLQGENRIAYYAPSRISSYEIGWRRQVYPTVPGGGYTEFLFDNAGELVALPIIKRDRVESEDRWSSRLATSTSARQIATVFDDVAAHADPNNVPLSEEEENRVAWLGVIMQALDTELARQLGVSELSDDGYTGGLVTFVYPESPAAESGIEVGDVLLRVHSKDLPTPVDVEVEELDEFASAFPWAQLDEVPEEYFEMIPPPWPKVNNAFNKRLTMIGFGTPIQLELAREGSVMMVDLVVTQSPVHYDAAPQYKSDPIGLTVRPLTYEVRRQLQKGADDPGVIVARIEPGSKASVAGVKPFELITAVNDQPIHTNDDFRRAIAGQTDLRLSMLRMTRSRLVKITLDAPIIDDEGGSTEEVADPMDEP